MGRDLDSAGGGRGLGGPLGPDPVRAWEPGWIPAYISNGLVGLRAGPVPLYEGVCIVGGLASIQPVDGVEGFARAPYPVGGDILLNGASLRSFQAAARFLEQSYDFSCGELSSRFAFEAGGAAATVEVLTFCCRRQPALVLQEVRVEVSSECELEVAALVDPTEIGGRWVHREAAWPDLESKVADGSLLWETHGGLSRCGAAYWTSFDGGEGVARTREDRDDLAPLRTAYAVRAHPGRRYVLRQVTSLVPDQLNSAPDREAVRLVTMGALTGFDVLREANREDWAELWKGRPVLVGAGARWQRLADAAFYYLHASSHPSSLFSTSMFGLAYWPNYHYYRGQVMWDLEAFAFPTLALTSPNTAAALLDFRFRRLDAAEDNAALNGYSGVQFPWASSLRRGDEAIRTDAPVVLFEQHVNFWVAVAFARYAHLVGDQDFLRGRAWPVLEGVAHWLETRGTFTERGFEIKRTLGPAEQRDVTVDNDACVNMAAAVVLREAAHAAGVLGRRLDQERWSHMASAMFLARGEGGVVLNHDRFTPSEGGVTGATPEALAGLFPAAYRLEPDAERATIDFYLGRVEPYLGSPMLCAPLGVYAAWNGERERSSELFEAGYAEYVFAPYLETHEFSRVRHPEKPLVGPFTANLGGFLTSLLFGLTGIVPGPGEVSSWFVRPPAMPSLWEGVEVERIWVRGEPARLVARQGEPRARIERL